MTLPVLAHRAEILGALAQHQALLVVADAGAGKSTQIPRMLLEAGYRVLVTEPRRLAVRTLSARVAEEMGVTLGGVIGYRLGRQAPHDGPETRLLYATDGLAMVRELLGGGGGYDVLVIDEVHQWSITIEVLLAWARRELDLGRKFKLVLLSATVDAPALAAYLGAPAAPAPVVSIPGRLHPIEDRAPASPPGCDLDTVISAIAVDARKYVEEGHNVLAFVPGKGEIDRITTLCQGMNAVILPLHGQMTQEEQDRCFQRYDRPLLVIATNIAETSITIDGIDVVLDSGFERRVEVQSGVEGIYTRLISRANAAQRRGRAGRTKPGIYVDHAKAVYGQRSLFPSAEIERVLLDQAALRLAEAGLDAATLPFFHQPNPHEIAAAKRMLHRLGAMTREGRVTPMGSQIARLPTSVRGGRALVEAHRMGGAALLDDVALASTLSEVGGIGDERVRDGLGPPRWRRHAGAVYGSDPISQIHAFREVGHLPEAELTERGFIGRKVLEVREHLPELIQAAIGVLGPPPNPDRAHAPLHVIRCLAAGMIDQVRARTWNEGGWPVFGSDERRIGRESVVSPGPRREFDFWDEEDDGAPPPAEMLVVGMPFDVGTKTGAVPILRFVSIIDMKTVLELGGEHVSRIYSDLRYDEEQDVVTAVERVTLFGVMLRQRRTPLEPGHRGAGRHLRIFLAEALTGRWHKQFSRTTIPHLVALRELVAGRERAVAINKQLGEDRWPIPTVEELYDRIPDDAVHLAPLLEGLACPVPTTEDCPSPRTGTPAPGRQRRKRERTLRS